MNKLFLISTTLFLFHLNTIKAEDYIKYNLEILDAQNHLINENFDSALIVYKSCFEIVKKPFPKDYRNAALTAYYTDSIILMKEYIERAVINGYHWRHSFKHQIKKSFNFYFKKDKIFLKHLDKKCDELIQIDLENPIYSKYLGLLDMDQKARKGRNKKKKEIEMINSDKFIYAELIKDGINENFYPGYITTGVYNYVDLSYVFAMHITLENYETIVINALKKGEITPYAAGDIYTRQYRNHNKGKNCTEIPELIIQTNSFYNNEDISKLNKIGYKFNSFI